MVAWGRVTARAFVWFRGPGLGDCARGTRVRRDGKHAQRLCLQACRVGMGHRARFFLVLRAGASGLRARHTRPAGR